MLSGFLVGCNNSKSQEKERQKLSLEKSTQRNSSRLHFIKIASPTYNNSRVQAFGKQVHGSVVRYGYEQNVFVANGLVDFYGKCREVSSACVVFDGICNRNDVSWCSMVAAYEQNDEGEKACAVHASNEVEPKDFTVSSVVIACAGIAGLEMGRLAHALSVKACIDGNVFVGSALVDIYAKCGNIEDCERMFDEMPERNLITWNALLGGYAHLRLADMAFALFEEMKRGECNAY